MNELLTSAQCDAFMEAHSKVAAGLLWLAEQLGELRSVLDRAAPDPESKSEESGHTPAERHMYIWSKPSGEAHIPFEFLDHGNKVRCFCGEVYSTRDIKSCIVRPRDTLNGNKALCSLCGSSVRRLSISEW
jgi:hypothetical protein